MSAAEGPSTDFYFRKDGSVRTYAHHPRLMPALERELVIGMSVFFPGQDTDSLCVMGDAVLRRLPWDFHGPLGPPLFVLSEPVELVPIELVRAVLELVDPDSDTGNEWIQAKVGLATEVRAAVDAFARRIAVLAGRRIVAAQ